MNLPENIEKQIADIPMISEVAHKLLAITADEKHSLRDVVSIVETDVYLATRVIRVANSAAYSRGREIDSIQRAVMHLGESLVTGIAISASTGSMLTKPLAGYDGPEGALWAHCLQTAIASREVARLTNDKVLPDQAYTAGLLMDIGMAVLSDHIADDMEKIIQRVDNRESHDFMESERESAGTDHAEIGERLASHWNLPKQLHSALRFHHRPSQAPEEDRPLVYTVHVADLIVRSAGFGVGAESLSYKLDTNYKEYIRLDRSKFEELLLFVMEEFSKIESFILTA